MEISVKKRGMLTLVSKQTRIILTKIIELNNNELYVFR